MKKSVKIAILLILAIIWMAIIFKLSSMNSNNSNGKSVGIIGLFIEDTLDFTNEYGITNSHPDDSKIARASELINGPMRKVIHASVYFVLAFFIITFLGIAFDYKKYTYMVIITFIVALLFAIGDEYHQTLVNGRTGRALDVIIDTAGACIGILFYSTYYWCFKCGYKNGYNKAIEEKIETKEETGCH